MQTKYDLKFICVFTQLSTNLLLFFNFKTFRNKFSFRSSVYINSQNLYIFFSFYFIYLLVCCLSVDSIKLFTCFLFLFLLSTRVLECVLSPQFFPHSIHLLYKSDLTFLLFVSFFSSSSCTSH
jgi:hypothetical protein